MFIINLFILLLDLSHLENSVLQQIQEIGNSAFEHFFNVYHFYHIKLDSVGQARLAFPPISTKNYSTMKTKVNTQ